MTLEKWFNFPDIVYKITRQGWTYIFVLLRDIPFISLSVTKARCFCSVMTKHWDKYTEKTCLVPVESKRNYVIIKAVIYTKELWSLNNKIVWVTFVLSAPLWFYLCDVSLQLMALHNFFYLSIIQRNMLIFYPFYFVSSFLSFFLVFFSPFSFYILIFLFYLSFYFLSFYFFTFCLPFSLLFDIIFFHLFSFLFSLASPFHLFTSLLFI